LIRLNPGGPMKDQAQQFLDYLRRERGLSPRTIGAYRRDLDQLLGDLSQRGIPSAEAVTEQDVRSLVARLHRRGQSARSLQRLPRQRVMYQLPPELQQLRQAALRRRAERQRLREDLALHFVQRRRKDIEEWQDISVFPRRLTAEITYRLTGDWGGWDGLCCRVAIQDSRSASQDLRNRPSHA